MRVSGWLRSHMQRLLRPEDGMAATEYGTMIALLIIVCIAGIRVLGTWIGEMLTSMADTVGGLL